MPTLDSVRLDDGLFTLFKGEPGTRKSTCALSYPLPQYWFSTDQKMEALKLPAAKWGVDMSKVHFDDYSDWAGPKTKLEQFRTNCPYKTLIVDSITSMGDAMTSQVRKMKKDDGKSTKTIGGIQVSGLEEFNAESQAFKEMISLLKDVAKYHKLYVILIAHVIGQRKDEDSNKQTHHSRIIVTGAAQIGAKIASYVTEAYHFNIRAGFEANSEGKYGCLTVHTGNDYARTSLPLPQEIEFNNDPLFSKWIEPAIKKQMAESPVTRIPSNNPTNVTPFKV